MAVALPSPAQGIPEAACVEHARLDREVEEIADPVQGALRVADQVLVEHDPEPVLPGTGTVLRTKADCLRICEQGCVAVVYPEGTWYARLDEEKLDRIIDEHLVGGKPVEDLIFAVGDLGR